MWLTLLAFRNSIAILMLSLAITVLGIVSLQRLPVDLFPSINLPIVQVGTIYRGAGVKDIEKSITYPIDKAVSAVSDVEHVESRSKQGVSLIQVWFNWGANIDAGEVEVIQKIQAIMNALPVGVQQPFVSKFDFSNLPVMTLTVSGEGYDEQQLDDIAYNTIEPQIEHLPHVASASVEGGNVRQVTVDLDRDLIQAKGISVEDAVNAIAESNLILASGNLKTGTLDYTVFTNNQFEVVQPMEDIVVKTVNGVPIHLKDIGQVSDSYQTQTSIVRMNGQWSVYLRVNTRPGANTVEVVDAVPRAIPTLLNIPKGLLLATSFDQSIYIRQSIEALMHEALQGSVLAFLVILVFLQSFTSTFIISLALVASFWVSRTVTPLLCAKLLPGHGIHARGPLARVAAMF